APQSQGAAPPHRLSHRGSRRSPRDELSLPPNHRILRQAPRRTVVASSNQPLRSSARIASALHSRIFHIVLNPLSSRYLPFSGSFASCFGSALAPHSNFARDRERHRTGSLRPFSIFTFPFSLPPLATIPTLPGCNRTE